MVLRRLFLVSLLAGAASCSSISGTPQSAPGTSTRTESASQTTTSQTPDEPTGRWTDALVVVTTNSVGAAKLGMTDEEVEAAAGVELTLECTQCDANFVADIEPKADHARFEVRHNCSGFDLVHVPTQTQVVTTEKGFELGGTVAELQELYGDDLEPYQAQGLHEFNGHAITGDDGRLVFRPNADDPSIIDGLLVWPLEYNGC